MAGASDADGVRSDPTAWWNSPDLERVWARIADRLERGGLRAEGRCVIDGLARAERHAVADLLGRSVTGARVVVDLSSLDERLRSRATVGLAVASGRVLGRPLEDRAERTARDRALRRAPVEAAADWAAGRPGVPWAWVDPWLEGLRRDRLLGGDDDPSLLVTTALDVLWARRDSLADSVTQGLVAGQCDANASRARAASTRPAVARGDLAARLCHDAHALDDDRRLSVVVLRGVALALDVPAPVDAGRRRDLWAAIGVLTDSVSATCLVWGLRTLSPRGDDVVDGQPVGPGSDRPSVPVHLTWWHLRAGLRVEPADRVLVCENPRVLEAVAEANRADVGVVCTSGWPNLVTREVLTGLASMGSSLLYHGDFDWPGIAMANDAVARFGAVPFRMSCADYESAPGSLALKGPLVEPSWDAELGASMRRRGVAVHEEAVLHQVVAGL